MTSRVMQREEEYLEEIELAEYASEEEDFAYDLDPEGFGERA